jgi:aconitate hydratase
MIIKPTMTSEIILGPNIKPLPKFDKLPESLDKKVILKVEDNITTDHIMPAGSKVLPYRSNIEKISEFVFYKVDENFKKNCNENNGGIIVGGNNYGQGSSREHAAIAPRYLGIRAVIAKGFARIHRQNLINFGIMPLTFVSEADYDKISQFDELVFNDLKLEVGKNIIVTNKTKGYDFEVCHGLTLKEINLINAGGLLNTL